MPLWSAVSTIKPDKNECTFSNAVVENWFGTLKTNILKSAEIRTRCSRFVRAVREVVVSVEKECRLNIEKTGCAVKKRKREINEQGMDAEETWKKKNKAKKAIYLSPTNFERFMPKFHSSPVTEKCVNIKLPLLPNGLVNDHLLQTLSKQKFYCGNVWR